MALLIDSYSSARYIPPPPPPAPLLQPPPSLAVKRAPIELPYSPFLPTSTPGTNATSFSDSVKGQQPQPDTDLDLALMSSDVYEVEGKPVRVDELAAHGWNRLEPDAAGVYTSPDGRTFQPSVPLENTDSGLRAAVYANADGQVVLAYAGTNDFPDVVGADAGQAFGIDSAQYNQAITLAKEAKAAFGDNVVFTGHSLGGGLASAASLATGNAAVTFNAAGLSNDTLRGLGFNPHDARELGESGQIRRYNIDGDPLTTAQQDVGILEGAPDAVGFELNLDHPNGAPDLTQLSPLGSTLAGAFVTDAHGGDTVVDAVRNIRTNPPTAAPSLTGDLYGTTLEIREAATETVLDFAGDVGDEFAGLLGDAYDVGYDFGGDLKDVVNNDYAKGDYVEGTFNLAGDVAEGGLNLAGDVANGAFDLVGDGFEGTGEFAGDVIRDFGELVGLKDAGEAVGGFVEDAGQLLGDVADGAGDVAETVFDGLGTAAEATVDFVGDVGQGVADGAEWVGDKVSSVMPWNW